MTEFERAVELHRQGLTPQAEALCREILARAPQHPRALHLLGAIRFAAGEKDAAIRLVEAALTANPDYAEARFNLGAMLADAGRPEAAAEQYRRAAELKPQEPEAWARLAAVLMNLGRAPEAEAAFRRALALRADDASALTDLCVLLHQRGELDESIACGRRAVALAPDLAVAHLRLGRALSDFGAGEAAVRHHRRAVELAPDQLDYRRALQLCLLYAPGAGEAERFAGHLAFGRAATARVDAPLLLPPNDRDPDRRLRVGWLSSDFRDHPVARNLQPFFAHRHRAGFEFVCYAETAVEDAMTEWFRGQADLWRPTSGLSDDAVARQIRADAIDLMMYPAGQFDRNRPQVAAWRPAPLQCVFNDQATSVLDAMDYLITDRVMAPRRTGERFTERVLRLPNFSVQLPPPDAPPVAPLPSAQSGAVTFGSFNNPAKLNREVLAAWAEILRLVPDARLRFSYRNWFTNTGLRERVRQALGPDVAARTEFDESARSRQGHLELHNLVDIVLDPFPFTGATTTFEALWMGVPVVTLLGANIAGRWSASMLNAAGLQTLIAASPADYVAKAVALARDTPGLAALRAGLRDRVAGSSLCDGPRMTRYLERILRAAWRRWCSKTRSAASMQRSP